MQAAASVRSPQTSTRRVGGRSVRLVTRAESVPPGDPADRPRRAAVSETGLKGGASADAGTHQSTGEGPLELKGGALWWQHLHNSATTPLYGTNFVLQRPRIGGPGLVRAVRHPKPIRHTQPVAAPPVVWSAPGSGAGLALAGSSLGSGSLVIDTEFEVLPPSSQPSEAAVQPNTTCVGIVWQRSADSEEAKAPYAKMRRSSKHPRRTQQLRFTCNLCGEVNDAAVNPHAWKKGSVFARCQGCSAVHKLKDNLNIFHELAGPVFPPRELRSNYLVQEILDRIRQNNRN